MSKARMVREIERYKGIWWVVRCIYNDAGQLAHKTYISKHDTKGLAQVHAGYKRRKYNWP